MGKRGRRKKIPQERITSDLGYGHATQTKHNKDIYQVFFHSDPVLGVSIQIGAVTRDVAVEMLKEMDETGADFEAVKGK